MCKHEEFLDSIAVEIKNNEQYWIQTEVFKYLHNGNSYCDCEQESKKREQLNKRKDDD
jgi:hypothetical protein